MNYSAFLVDILLWLGYAHYDPLDETGDFEVSQSGGVVTLTWYNTDPSDVYYPDGPTPADIESQEKSWAAHEKREEIYAEQEFRSVTVIGFPLPQQVFSLMEETYTQLLVPQATNSITQASTPLWWGIKRLRDNRNTLLNNLQIWVDDSAKTAEDILAFDVETWPGWDIERP